MKRNRKSARRRRQVLRIWSREQAQAVFPYLGSVVRSLREHWLEAQSHRLSLNRLANRKGRPDRARLIAEEEESRAIREANARFQQALEELQALDIYCFDPIRGEVLIPFVNENQLAWYLFDLFDVQGLRFWRYQSDPFETRRPITELCDSPAGQKRAV